MVYTFESEINTWSGVIATDELIAQDIEDQIDDSKLDPCPKGVMAQLKKINNYEAKAIVFIFCLGRVDVCSASNN